MYVEQVREAYATGQIDLDRLNTDLDTALILDHEAPHPGAGMAVPHYFKDRDGRLLAAPSWFHDLWFKP